ncbi:hypothetical protein HK100_000421 [Physocladia obscura]|uniref:Uncharacterized protein n=1 Tax=Physocladia obscura TaxID=109957 RepID=A0AAD5SYN1_9FUNG|nr:hypothetical protein HK100_000421 [Physocladia obscura]
MDTIDTTSTLSDSKTEQRPIITVKVIVENSEAELATAILAATTAATKVEWELSPSSRQEKANSSDNNSIISISGNSANTNTSTSSTKGVKREPTVLPAYTCAPPDYPPHSKSAPAGPSLGLANPASPANPLNPLDPSNPSNSSNPSTTKQSASPFNSWRVSLARATSNLKPSDAFQTLLQKQRVKYRQSAFFPSTTTVTSDTTTTTTNPRSRSRSRPNTPAENGSPEIMPPLPSVPPVIVAQSIEAPIPTWGNRPWPPITTDQHRQYYQMKQEWLKQKPPPSQF